MQQPRPDDDQRAKGRFLAINAMRVTGVVMVLMGIAIVRGAIDLPDVAAYVLIALGLVEAFVAPAVLARVWRSSERGDLEGPPRP
ncbi:hypothetical protein [Alteraurantiacibacter buctensis]|uniref:Uncharacterized protein n=1 Tax=Alteraurantiacibacter buctensis TaxID=1503981 RepID=A0A844YYT1_9SPHN|nr:hypothetical protein [Alteraurantiacibacter buctensis]MXO72709.1 hypothetical protein [Alteraurantiacibacter buctensis]